MSALSWSGSSRKDRAARRDDVVAAARAAYGPSEDFRGVRDAWDAVFPDGTYSATGLAEAKRLA